MKYIAFLIGIVALCGCGDRNETNQPAPVTTTPVAEPSRTIPLTAYGRAQISVKGTTIDVYVADENAERAEGLMFLTDEDLKPDEGMIFVFAQTEPLSFWMENTLLPLDIAYLDPAGKILNIRQMQPLDTSPQPSAGPAKYAVEMHENWFKGRGIKQGDKFDLAGLSK